MNCVTSSFIKNLAFSVVFTVDRQINCVDYCIEICNFRICFLMFCYPSKSTDGCNMEIVLNCTVKKTAFLIYSPKLRCLTF